jgi:hypothetical protein
MDNYPTLVSALDQLKAQRQVLQAQGPALFDCWIAESKPGGTAINARRHFQLRSRKPQFNGKKSRYLRAAELGEYRAAIARGRASIQLGKQILKLEQRIDAMTAFGYTFDI